MLILLLIFTNTPVKAADTGSDTSKIILSLDFAPSDALMDPTLPVIYLTDGSHNRVVAVNYETGTQSMLAFNLRPEHLTYANGELFVTLLKTPHQYYNPATLSGEIAIINPKTWTVTDQFTVATDPYSIAVDRQGFIYITPGSNQWGYMLVYSRASKALVGSTNNSNAHIRAWSLAMLQPETDKLYTVGTEMVSSLCRT
ncbi:MAG: hypothetical protein GX434_09415 [Peptococcaceae bacterium]|nr:hypothetical protein [Peptococcaceae bacterium]